MVQSIKEEVMEKTKRSTDECRRFVELFLYFNNEVRSYLNDYKELTDRVTSICSSTLKEIVPVINEENYQNYARSSKPKKRKLGGFIARVYTPYEAQIKLEQRLKADDFISQILPKEDLDVFCSRVGYNLGEAYLHHMHNKLWPRSKLPQNIFQ